MRGCVASAVVVHAEHQPCLLYVVLENKCTQVVLAVWSSPARYAGAGLFDSVQSVEPQAVPVDYTADQLFTDPATQQQVLGRIALAAAAVEQAAGSAQDIEGVVTADGRVFIVQTRPQV